LHDELQLGIDGNNGRKFVFEIWIRDTGCPPPKAVKYMDFHRRKLLLIHPKSFLRKEIRAGYRAPYLLELSNGLRRENSIVKSWRSSDVPTQELFDEVRSVKGVVRMRQGTF